MVSIKAFWGFDWDIPDLPSFRIPTSACLTGSSISSAITNELFANGGFIFWSIFSLSKLVWPHILIRATKAAITAANARMEYIKNEKWLEGRSFNALKNVRDSRSFSPCDWTAPDLTSFDDEISWSVAAISAEASFSLPSTLDCIDISSRCSNLLDSIWCTWSTTNWIPSPAIFCEWPTGLSALEAWFTGVVWLSTELDLSLSPMRKIAWPNSAG